MNSTDFLLFPFKKDIKFFLENTHNIFKKTMGA